VVLASNQQLVGRTYRLPTRVPTRRHVSQPFPGLSSNTVGKFFDFSQTSGGVSQHLAATTGSAPSVADSYDLGRKVEIVLSGKKTE
jgi:hypothetical protein